MAILVHNAKFNFLVFCIEVSNTKIAKSCTDTVLLTTGVLRWYPYKLHEWLLGRQKGPEIDSLFHQRAAFLGRRVRKRSPGSGNERAASEGTVHSPQMTSFKPCPTQCYTQD